MTNCGTWKAYATKNGVHFRPVSTWSVSWQSGWDFVLDICLLYEVHFGSLHDGKNGSKA